jgi:hypothetical protein
VNENFETTQNQSLIRFCLFVVEFVFEYKAIKRYKWKMLENMRKKPNKNHDDNFIHVFVELNALV